MIYDYISLILLLLLHFLCHRLIQYSNWNLPLETSLARQKALTVSGAGGKPFLFGDASKNIGISRQFFLKFYHVDCSHCHCISFTALNHRNKCGPCDHSMRHRQAAEPVPWFSDAFFVSEQAGKWGRDAQHWWCQCSCWAISERVPWCQNDSKGQVKWIKSKREGHLF